MPILLKRWMPLFNVDSKQMDTMVIWVRLPSLPLEFWNPASLKDLGNAIGAYLEVDFSYLQTQRRVMELILVSIDIRIELKECLNLIRGNVTR